MVKPRAPTPEEQALWRRATQDVRACATTEMREEEANSDAAPEPEKEQQPQATTHNSAQPGPKQRGAIVIDDLHTLDGANARRLKRAQVTIDAVLDLHGYGRTEAFVALEQALRGAAQEGVRVMAIITGKGRGNEGVLKQALPGWLNDPTIRPYVVAASTAPPHMGGVGAVLVWCARRR